jgi:hypothetical protein
LLPTSGSGILSLLASGSAFIGGGTITNHIRTRIAVRERVRVTGTMKPQQTIAHTVIGSRPRTGATIIERPRTTSTITRRTR